MRKPKYCDVKIGLNLKLLGSYYSSKIEYFSVVGIESGWAFFSDGECAEIEYICSDRSQYFVDEDDCDE